ncbi:carboxypeptidase regulatory-like domain-containing protein [Aliishimia ponticola]|uniref:Carboxypeptidase regulatory-like domain-containing protein n=1 Tax=Aliishimia ponticola TaxID=2499833 RepID=A0A4S4NFA1_9RHOB|nr:carboxypeptidase-like regulatory domain-containing protein [Aliishimia ponticola]THH38199.1 carboxypeptidase regulatory-like domain-containing protein [Aliishimia ponticola]
MTRALILLALLCAPLPALAHKVIAGVFASGSAIEGEIGLSNGEMAAGVEVIVTGPDGTELGRALTDADGFFIFTPTQPVRHDFRANLGAGHVANVTMPAGEVAQILGVAAQTQSPAPTAPATGPATGAPVLASLSPAERQVIAQIVRDEMRPLRREIAAYRERNDLQTILGGLGYIAGLFGIGFYMAARRKLSS